MIADNFVFVLLLSVTRSDDDGEHLPDHAAVLTGSDDAVSGSEAVFTLHIFEMATFSFPPEALAKYLTNPLCVPATSQSFSPGLPPLLCRIEST